MRTATLNRWCPKCGAQLRADAIGGAHCARCGWYETDPDNARPKSIALYVADTYGRGCPSNRAGRRFGVGLTSLQAINACEPWANQAPWFRRRARKLTITNGERLTDATRDYVWHVLGYAWNGDTSDVVERLRAALQGTRGKGG